MDVPIRGMEAECGSTAAAVGTFLSLSEQEQRYYSELHAWCQTDGSGKLSSVRVAELFKASQLPPDALHKVTEVCGAQRLGYFGTAQFYVALKLLSAAQSALPLRIESTSANLPLPRFVGLHIEAEVWYPSATAGGGEGTGPGFSWTKADRNAYRHVDSAVEKELWSPPRSPSVSPPRSPPGYHGYAFPRNGTEPHMVYDPLSSRSVTHIETNSSPGHISSSDLPSAPLAQSGSCERLDQQEAVSGEDDPWRITEEQLQYYTHQFTRLQPDLGALIIGALAKDFFTKSKLPIPELSHIWELSDVDRDGALTFSEFCTAFHLIVARKNGYPLPESLPPPLRAVHEKEEEDEEEEDEEEEEEVPDTPQSAEPLIVFEDPEMNTQRTEIAQIKLNTSEEDTKQADARVRAAALFQPTPLSFPQRPEPPLELEPQTRIRTRPRSYSSTSIEEAMKREEPPTPPPRPQKSHSRASSLDLNKLFQQGALGAKSGWLPPPPALPPRPAPSQFSHFAVENPPQNKVPQPNFADFSHFREEEESSLKIQGSRFRISSEDNSAQDLLLGAPQKPARRKFHPEIPNMDVPPLAMTLAPPTKAPPTKAPQKLLSKQKREIQMAIRKNKETNAVLRRLNSELQQQLKVAHQERVTLESHLELVRPAIVT